MLERRQLHHSPVSVGSSPAPTEPMSGTRNRPMLVEESPAPHYVMVKDCPALQCIVVEVSLVPVSGKTKTAGVLSLNLRGLLMTGLVLRPRCL